MDTGGMIYPENALVLAPLSGFTDIAYRRAARRGGCRFAFTEMIDAASIAYASERTKPMLYRGEEEDFLGVQLVGADPALIEKAVRYLNELDFSLLDFNLGCPVPKVAGKGAGAALGCNYDHAMRCFEVIARLSRFPVTAKMRILDENDPEPSVRLACGLASLGAKAITVHGRTRRSFYTGKVHFEIISAIRQALPEVEVIANGGVHTVEDCAEIREKSGCSRVMLAQGAMGNPWLFREIETGCEPPDIEEWRSMVITHVTEMVGLYGEYSGMRQARKIVHDYLKGRGFGGAPKSKASLLSNLTELHELIYNAVPVAVSPQRKIKYSPLLSENTI